MTSSQGGGVGLIVALLASRIGVLQFISLCKLQAQFIPQAERTQLQAITASPTLALQRSTRTNTHSDRLSDSPSVNASKMEKDT